MINTSEISVLTHREASEWFAQLPPMRRIATLSPDYVVADASRDVSFEPVFLGYREGDSVWLHGMLRGRVPGTDYFDLQSPYGYGGPVMSGDAAFCGRAWQAYVRWCADNRILVEFVRLHPLASDWQVYPGKQVHDRMTVCMPLTGDLWAGYSPRCRTALRKAQRLSVQFSEKPKEEIATLFPDFYRSGMAAIGADAFYVFSDSYFHALAALPQAHLFVCEAQGQWAAAGLFLQGETTLEYHLSAAGEKGRQLCATNQLIDGAAHWGKNTGLDTLYLGGGTNADEANPLYFFKSSFSKIHIPFSYGYFIHDPLGYGQLQAEYKTRGALRPRVLFYR